jgi:hypothetical protein
VIKHIQRRTKRTPAQTARLRADREHYQRRRPSEGPLLARADAMRYSAGHWANGRKAD